MGEARRKFDQDFKEGAVRLVRETGKPDSHRQDQIRPRAQPRATMPLRACHTSFT